MPVSPLRGTPKRFMFSHKQTNNWPSLTVFCLNKQTLFVSTIVYTCTIPNPTWPPSLWGNPSPFARLSQASSKPKLLLRLHLSPLSPFARLSQASKPKYSSTSLTGRGNYLGEFNGFLVIFVSKYCIFRTLFNKHSTGILLRCTCACWFWILGLGAQQCLWIMLIG